MNFKLRKYFCCIKQYHHCFDIKGKNSKGKNLCSPNGIPIITVETCAQPEELNGYEQFKSRHMRKALTIEYIENMNKNIDNLDVLNFMDLINNDIKNFIRPKSMVLGLSDIDIELHKDFTENERLFFIRRRYKRRYAVQIENVDDLKVKLKTFMSLVKFNFYWTS